MITLVFPKPEDGRCICICICNLCLDPYPLYLNPNETKANFFGLCIESGPNSTNLLAELSQVTNLSRPEFTFLHNGYVKCLS